MTSLVLWRIELALLSSHLLRAVLQMGDYSASAQRSGMISGRYNVVGAHGGAWLCEVASNEELEQLLARAPIYNFARFEVLPLASLCGCATPPSMKASGDEVEPGRTEEGIAAASAD